MSYTLPCMVVAESVLYGGAMDEKVKETLRKKLLDAERQFSQHANRLADAGRNSVPEGVLDEGDRAESTYQKEFLFSTSVNSSELLQMVQGALGRMNDGSFGRCLSCAKEIPTARLEAVPWTHYCIECQQRIEGAEQNTQSAA